VTDLLEGMGNKQDIFENLQGRQMYKHSCHNRDQERN